MNRYFKKQKRKQKKKQKQNPKRNANIKDKKHVKHK